MGMVFHRDTAVWFDKQYVAMEVPPVADLETWLEVGAWTWSWMEPPLGTISFVLLCAQFSRQQMRHVWKETDGPYNVLLKRRRVKGMLAAYPQYSPVIVASFADS